MAIGMVLDFNTPLQTTYTFWQPMTRADGVNVVTIPNFQNGWAINIDRLNMGFGDGMGH